VTHLLFIDDVILCGEGTVREWRDFKNILEEFFSIIVMEVGLGKFLILHNGIPLVVLEYVHLLLPYSMYEI
jgi:hypothetical protein